MAHAHIHTYIHHTHTHLEDEDVQEIFSYLVHPVQEQLEEKPLEEHPVDEFDAEGPVEQHLLVVHKTERLQDHLASWGGLVSVQTYACVCIGVHV